ncbi:MAG: histidine kinase [Clostridia bacterium]|nr:histidine kinase [Clostridia bacterium]
MKAYPKAIGRAAALVLLALFFCGATADQARTWSALQDAVDRAGDDEVIALSGDLTALEADAEITVPAGKRLTLDLNGHRLDASADPGQTGRKRCAINIRAGAMLTLRDSGGTGVITGGFHDNGGGVVNRGTLIMEGGCVTGNTALHSGGGIANYGTMVLAGGSVAGNTALRDGSDVFNEAKGHLTVGGAMIVGDGEAKREGICNEGTLTVIGDRYDEVHIEEMPLFKRFIARQSAIPTAVLLVALLLTVWLDNYLSAERKRVMGVIIVLVFSLILQNYMDNRLSLAEVYNALRIPVSIYGYAIRPVILVMFLYIVKPRGRYCVAWAMVAANAAVYLTAFFSNIAFYFSSNGHFHAGPLRHTCTLISAVLYAWLFWLTMRQFRPRQRRESWIPILVTALIGGAAIMDFTVAFIEQPVAYLTMAIAISCVFYYTWLHLQFVREHEDALVTGQRVQQMLSQIKPHFLHNALTLIIDLCDTAPQKAKEATVEFSRYLRGNMESIDRTGPISFENELEHTKLYLDIEQMRFAGDLQVRYDIACTGFSLPALTVEPLAENAVRHGVREKPDGRGTVVIATRETPDGYEITVTDDGPGFDPDRLPEDGQMHVGIANVRERLRQIVDGSLEYRSAPGEGTAAIIRIPKQ